jgi:ankyrin repeat protein
MGTLEKVPSVRSALHFAAALGNVKITQMLCQAGADVDLGDKDGAELLKT